MTTLLSRLCAALKAVLSRPCEPVSPMRALRVASADGYRYLNG